MKLIISGINVALVCIMAWLCQRERVGYINSFLFCIVSLITYYVWLYYVSYDLLIINAILMAYSLVLMLVANSKKTQKMNN